MRQVTLLILSILLGLVPSARGLAQANPSEEVPYSLIKNYANILFFTGAQESAIGYLYYLCEAYPYERIKTTIPLASWLDLAGRRGEAEELLHDLFKKQAAQVYANLELVQYYLTLLYNRNQIDKADSIFTILPPEVAAHPDIRLIRLMSLSTQDKHRQVLEQIKLIDPSILTNQKQKETYYLLLAESAFKEQDYEQVLQATDKLVKLPSNNIAGYQLRLQALNALGLDAELIIGLTQLQKNFSLPDNYIDVTYADLIRSRHDPKQSADYLYRYLQRQDTVTPFVARITSILLPDFSDISQIPQEFIPALTRLAEIEPSDPNLFADVYRMVLMYQGNKQAENLLGEFYNNPRTAYSAVLVKVTQLTDPKKLHYINSARKRYPKDLQILALYIEELISRNRLTEALQTISSQLELDNLTALKGMVNEKGLRPLLLYTTIIYQTEGNTAKALQTFDIAEQIYPRDAILLNNYAYYLYTLSRQDKSRLAQAKQLAETAYSLAPEEPAILDTYGAILLAQGNSTMALLMLSQAVERANELGRPNADYIERLGDAYLLAKDIKSALEQWHQAYKIRQTETLLLKIKEHRP